MFYLGRQNGYALIVCKVIYQIICDLIYGFWRFLWNQHFFLYVNLNTVNVFKRCPSFQGKHSEHTFIQICKQHKCFKGLAHTNLKKKV